MMSRFALLEGTTGLGQNGEILRRPTIGHLLGEELPIIVNPRRFGHTS